MNFKFAVLTGLLILVFGYGSAQAQLSRLETNDLRLIYAGKAYEYLVPHAARCFENALMFHSRLWNYHSKEKITVFLQDFSDYGNAGAGPLPNNLVQIYLAPFSYAYETMPANERMNWLMNHELTHIVATDKSSSRDRFFRSVFFGKVAPTPDAPVSMLYSYLTNPRWYAPRWYHEGIAVFMETWMAGGLGRALGAYDEMVFRTKVRDSAYIYDVVGLESEGTTTDFQVGVNSYLYGTRFISFLAYEYGPEKVLQWVSRNNESSAYFSSQFKKVFEKPLDDEWSRWIKWENDWQNANLDSIRTNPTSDFRPVSEKALGSVSRPFYDDSSNKIYVAVNYPGQIGHIAAIDLDSGKLKKICNVKGAALFYVTSLAFDPAGGKLFYATDNNRWRDLNVVDIRSGKSKLLLKDCRTGDLAFSQADSSLWGIRHYNGISTLVRIPHPYKEWNQIYSFEYGKDIFDIDVSPDGKTIVGALVEVNGNQKLIRMDADSLLSGVTSYQVIFDFEVSTPANFVFSPDGKFLFGSSYYSGVSDIYRYDVDNDDMSIISNCETGFFRPTPISNDSLVVFRYTGKGFVPVVIANATFDTVGAIRYLGNEIAQKYPVVRSWVLGSPASVAMDSATIKSGSYSSLANIGLSSAYPVVEGYKDFAAVGMRFNFADRLSVSGFDVTVSYTPDGSLPEDERLHAALDFHHWNWTMTAKYNAGNFYDLFGPTKFSRKGYSLGLGYAKNFIFDKPRTLDLSVNVTGYGDLETLPDFQNVGAPFDKILRGRINLDYRYVLKSLGAVDDEKGVQWQLISTDDYVNSDHFLKIFSNLDFGAPLPINHSSVWLRTSGGYGFGDRDNPFANFFFGGFGNNWVDHLTEKRYREYDSFPGLEINEIGGKTFAKAMLEWNLPPVRFRHFGVPAFYFNWARLALFSSGITINPDKSANRQTYFNLGAQLDLRLVLFSHLRSTLSVGFAAAMQESQSVKDAASEFMLSLKIL